MSGVTICIPTVREDVAKLRPLLERLALASSLSHTTVEVILAGGRLAPCSFRLAGLHVRAVASEAPAFAARNAAASAGSGSYLAFLDDDVMPSRKYGLALERAIQRLERDSLAVGIVGLTHVQPAVTQLQWAWTRAGFDRFFDLARRAEWLRWGCTANLVVRRTVWERIGGFARTPVPVGGEDIDFGVRATATRAFLAAPDLTVVHASRRDADWTALLDKAWAYGRSEQWLAVRHPRYSQAPAQVPSTGSPEADSLLRRFVDGRCFEAGRTRTDEASVSPAAMALDMHTGFMEGAGSGDLPRRARQAGGRDGQPPGGAPAQSHSR